MKFGVCLRLATERKESTANDSAIWPAQTGGWQILSLTSLSGFVKIGVRHKAADLAGIQRATVRWPAARGYFSLVNEG